MNKGKQIGIWFIVVLFVFLISASCKTPNDSSNGPVITGPTTTNHPPLPAYQAFGLDFSPYKAGQDPNLRTQIPISQIREMIGKIAPYTQAVRSFGTEDGVQNICQVAHEYGLQCYGGAWLSSNTADNDVQINNLISIGKAGYMDRAIVGSEVMLRGDLTEAQLIVYLDRVRTELPGIQVSTGEVYSALFQHPNLMAACDFLFVNYYPYWEGVKVDEAIALINTLHHQMINANPGKEVMVSETGWPSCGNSVGYAVPSPANACLYFLNFVSWARTNNVKYFYFEAFDEPWKANYEGPQGSCWGIWDESGIMKPGMQDVFDGKIISP